jgi:hydroxymethylglutaryl-CoA lyase
VTRPRHVRIVEVGPRDGLQNEPAHIPTDAKIAYVDLLSEAGFEMIETTSFVHPKAVPQLADADEVLRRVNRRDSIRYPVLVPNPRGLERAIAAGATEIAVFLAATETFSGRNINRTIADSLADARAVVADARRHNLWVRAYVSVAFLCPFEGPVAPEQVRAIAQPLLDLGADEIDIGDTTGAATPGHVERLLEFLLPLAPIDRWAMHFHDTRGTALANVLTSLEHGIFIFDSSAGGLGGCPFAGPNATGNLATEDLVYLLDGMRIPHGVSLEGVIAASRYIEPFVGHPLTSKVYRVEGKPAA